jgi:translation initiation factor 2B subunit (eIF-2B alpha/beta/delta family)
VEVLKSAGIPCLLLLDSTVGYLIDKVKLSFRNRPSDES